MTDKTIYQIIKEINKHKISLLNFKEYYTPVQLATELNYIIKSGFAEIDWIKKEVTILDFTESNLVSKRNKKDNVREVPENLKTEKIEPNKPKLY